MQNKVFDVMKRTFNKKFSNFFVFLFIYIAISCIITLFSIVSTAKKQILSDMENMGANVLQF